MRSYLSCFLLLLWSCAASAATEKTYETNISRRERNLDHWDAETLAAYLGLDPNTAEPLPDVDTRYAGIDASIMFYAQWCKNCHRFAPVWDAIAKIAKAGTTQSNLIMALFNCELNDQHTKLCDASGVTHYPTIMFVGAGPITDTDPVSTLLFGGKEKASGPFGATKLKRTVKFQGDLNVGDSVLDWVRTMQGLSKWYQWGHMDGGWLKTIRNLFFNPFDRKKAKQDVQKNSLPVGVPPALGTAYRSGSGDGSAAKSSYVLEKELNEAEKKMKKLKGDMENYELATSHAGFLIESFLFPIMSNATEEGGDSKPLDVFAVLNENKAWDAKLSSVDGNEKKVSMKDDKDLIIKSCVVDLTLDYCTRLSKKLTTEYLDSLSGLSQDKYPSFTEMEKQLREIVKDNEPYCAMFDDCYKDNFKDDKCRPATCPYKNGGACVYVGSCLTENIMEEYKDALEAQITSKDETKAAV